MDTTICPNPDVLADYVLGKVSEADLSGIASHVEACPACQAQLETLDGLSDTVITCLRRVTGDEAESDDSVLKEVLRQDRFDHVGARLEFARSRRGTSPSPSGWPVSARGKAGPGAPWGPFTRLSTPS